MSGTTYLLGLITFCSSIHCLDLWLCLHSKIAEPVPIIPPQATSALLHSCCEDYLCVWRWPCGKSAGTPVPARCNAWPCQSLCYLPVTFCLWIFRLPNLTPQLSSVIARGSGRPPDEYLFIIKTFCDG